MGLKKPLQNVKAKNSVVEQASVTVSGNDPLSHLEETKVHPNDTIETQEDLNLSVINPNDTAVPSRLECLIKQLLVGK